MIEYKNPCLTKEVLSRIAVASTDLDQTTGPQGQKISDATATEITAFLERGSNHVVIFNSGSSPGGALALRNNFEPVAQRKIGISAVNGAWLTLPGETEPVHVQTVESLYLIHQKAQEYVISTKVQIVDLFILGTLNWEPRVLFEQLRGAEHSAAYSMGFYSKKDAEDFQTFITDHLPDNVECRVHRHNQGEGQYRASIRSNRSNKKTALEQLESLMGRNIDAHIGDELADLNTSRKPPEVPRWFGCPQDAEHEVIQLADFTFSASTEEAAADFFRIIGQLR